MKESPIAASRSATNLPAALSAPKEFIKGCLNAYIESNHGKTAPEWTQAEHSRFLLYAVSRLLPLALEEAEVASLLAVLDSLGLGGNASQFRQHFSDAKKGGSILPSKPAPGSASLMLD